MVATSRNPHGLLRYTVRELHDRSICPPATCLLSKLPLGNEARSDTATTIMILRHTNTGGLRPSTNFSQQHCLAGLEGRHHAIACEGWCSRRLFYCCTSSEYDFFNAGRSGIDWFGPENSVCVPMSVLWHVGSGMQDAWEKSIFDPFWRFYFLLCMRNCVRIVNRWTRPRTLGGPRRHSLGSEGVVWVVFASFARSLCGRAWHVRRYSLEGWQDTTLKKPLVSIHISVYCHKVMLKLP